MIPAATRSVIRFGAFELDLDGGQIRKSGLRVKLRPQAFQLLILLAQRSGEVVSREAIIKELWGEGAVVDFDQGLNFCIRQIRAALGDDADSPRFIETIPRRGYKFLVPVTVSDPTPPLLPEVPGVLPPSLVRVRTHLYWMAAATVVFVAGGAWYFWPVSPEPLWRAVPLTSYPGFEQEPTLSPEGNQVAFTWDGEKQDNFDIYIKPVGHGAPLRLTTDPAQDVSPAWSPDGGEIAFLRRMGANRNELRVVPALGGAERKLTETRSEFRIDVPRRSVAWSPDGRWLVVSHRDPEDVVDGLFLVSRETGDKRRLTMPPKGFFGDYMPAFARDGRSIAFCRLSGYAVANLYLLPLTQTGQAEAEPGRLPTEGQSARNPVWARDGKRILYLADSELRTVAVFDSRKTDRVLLRENDISEMSLGRHLVYSIRTLDSNIWRAEIGPSGGPPSVPQRFIASTRMDGMAQYSPDGKRIAFATTRSGVWEIWIAQADGSAAAALTPFGGRPGVMSWSPDSGQIVFGVTIDGQSDIFTISAAGGARRRLTTHLSDDIIPSYSRDGRWIYFTSRRSGRSQIWKMPAGPQAKSGDATQITQNEGGYMAIESTDGKTLYYCHDLPEKGIWKMPVVGGKQVQVTGPYSPRLCGLAVAATGIYYTAAPDSSKRHSIQFVSHSSGESRPVVISDRPIGSVSLSVSSDERFLIYRQYDQSGSDLMLIEEFRGW